MKIGAFYRFVDIAEPEKLQTWAKELGVSLNLCGTMLIANEGLNGTLAGAPEKLDQFFSALVAKTGALEIKYSFAPQRPFRKFQVKYKKEIITFKQPVDPNVKVGTYVEAKDWNQLISRDDVLLVDTRNDYEIETGTFQGAINPDTENFTEFASYVRENLKDKEQPVAMFCTGGIRCEKASSFLLEEGFENVYHLKGGILKYLEDVPVEETMWEGECFVFDGRVTVNHDLKPGNYFVCYMCGWPVSKEDADHKYFEPGVSCKRCFGEAKPHVVARARERQKQLKLAAERGEVHMTGYGPSDD